MRHLYVPLLLVIVSGDMNVNITGYLKRDVLLQCDCKGMNQSMGFKWQITTNKFFCYQHSSPSGMSTNCTRHIESIDNCGIRLTNITKDDNGTYKCLFTRMYYNRNIFYLEVNMTSLPPEVSTTPPPTVKSRHFTEISTSINHRWICFTIAAILLLSGCIWTVLRRRRRNPPQEAVNQDDTEP